MKTRTGFVSNSSATSFTITNKTNQQKTLVDFVNENPQLLEDFLDTYDWYKSDDRFTPENLLKSAEENDLTLFPGPVYCTFGDEDGTIIGHVFDYALRAGGSSTSFTWKFEEYNR
jgi:hypothetical protein